MFEFKKYNDIENVREDRLEFLNALMIDPKVYWVAHEKLHGANFSIWVSKDTIRYASRNQWVDETFYNCQDVLDNLKPHLHQLQDHIKDCSNPDKVLTIFGELFGDKIQKGVIYPQGKHFMAFDIMTNYAYIDYRNFIDYCATFNIPTVPFINAGTLESVLQLPVEFLTRLNPIEGNVAEGLVIKPNQPLFFPNGSRVIFKRKSARFVEKNHTKRTFTNPKNLSGYALELVRELEPYINENRLNCVISKLGQVQLEDFNKLQGLLIQDCIKDYEVDTNTFNTKDKFKDDWKAIHKQLCVLAVPVVKAMFSKQFGVN
jgi:Rnl2 family RNA ligase